MTSSLLSGEPNLSTVGGSTGQLAQVQQCPSDLTPELHEAQLTDETQPAKASLLGLPYEIRSQILKLVFTGQPFLSSKQQFSASVHPRELGRQAHSDPPVRPNSNQISSTDDEKSSGEVKDVSIRRWQYKAQSRFYKPSSAFRQYGESRHADTALLYTCSQLRAESAYLWDKYRYYLTLILEYPMSDYAAHKTSRTAQIAQEKADDTLYFAQDRAGQREFWLRVKGQFKWPEWTTVRKFKKFHISLFLEDLCFASLTRGRPLLDGLKTAEIVGILLSREEDEYTAELSNVRLMDHTSLDLVCDAVDDSTRIREEEQVDAGITFSIELWKTW